MNALPTPTITATPATVCAGQSAVISYTGNAPSTPHMYGVFRVELLPPVLHRGLIRLAGHGPVQNVGVSVTENGCSSDTVIQVAVDIAPTSPFTVAGPLCVGENVTVTYTGNAPNTATYPWLFPGGTPGGGTNQGPYQVSWATPGTKTLSLTVTQGVCSSDTMISVVINTIPTPTITAAYFGFTGQNTNITYAGNASGTATYAWSFPGGTPATGNTQGPYQVSWPAAATENIALTVTENGCTSDTTIAITVNAAPTPTFTASPTRVNQSSTVTYTGNATGAAIYAWTFAGGTPATGNTAGPYQITYGSPR